MTIDVDFFEIEDEFISCIEDGLSRDDAALLFDYDPKEFSAYIESNEDALKAERRAQVKVKRDLLKAAKDKGTVKAINEYFGDVTPELTVEFKRGDMRTPDEIIITNTEGFEKKSLSLLLLGGCSKS